MSLEFLTSVNLGRMSEVRSQGCLASRRALRNSLSREGHFSPGRKSQSAKRELVETLSEQLADADRKRARVVYGPIPPGGKGFFFRPAILYDVNQDMRIVTEEVFGPILPVLVAETEEEIIEMATASSYGLGATIWTKDLVKGEHLAKEMEAGFVAVNDVVKSDPRLPFGGSKNLELAVSSLFTD